MDYMLFLSSTFCYSVYHNTPTAIIFLCLGDRQLHGLITWPDQWPAAQSVFTLRPCPVSQRLAKQLSKKYRFIRINSTYLLETASWWILSGIFEHMVGAICVPTPNYGRLVDLPSVIYSHLHATSFLFHVVPSGLSINSAPRNSF